MLNGFVGISTDRYNRGPVKSAARYPVPQAMPSALGRGAGGGDRPTAPGCGAARRLTFCPWLHHTQGVARPPLSVPQSRDSPYCRETSQVKADPSPSKGAAKASPAAEKSAPAAPQAAAKTPATAAATTPKPRAAAPRGLQAG